MIKSFNVAVKKSTPESTKTITTKLDQTKCTSVSSPGATKNDSMKELMGQAGSNQKPLKQSTLKMNSSLNLNEEVDSDK